MSFRVGLYVHVQTNFIYNCLYFFSIMYYTTHLYTESEAYMIKHETIIRYMYKFIYKYILLFYFEPSQTGT